MNSRRTIDLNTDAMKGLADPSPIPVMRALLVRTPITIGPSEEGTVHWQNLIKEKGCCLSYLYHYGQADK